MRRSPLDVSSLVERVGDMYDETVKDEVVELILVMDPDEE